MWLGAFALAIAFAQAPDPGSKIPSPASKVSPHDLNRVSIGSAAPAFQLPDAKGATRTLASFRGAPAVLVFYRGSW